MPYCLNGECQRATEKHSTTISNTRGWWWVCPKKYDQESAEMLKSNPTESRWPSLPTIPVHKSPSRQRSKSPLHRIMCHYIPPSTTALDMPLYDATYPYTSQDIPNYGYTILCPACVIVPVTPRTSSMWCESLFLPYSVNRHAMVYHHASPCSSASH